MSIDQNILDLLDGKKFAPGTTQLQPIHSEYGVPPQTLAAVREFAGDKLADKHTTATLRTLQEQYETTYGDLNREAEFTSRQRYDRHLEELTTGIMAGTDVSAFSGFSVEEFETERRAVIDGHKQVLKNLTDQAFALLQPILRAGAAASLELLKRELQLEMDRNARFGHPTLAPSQIPLSLRDCGRALARAAEAAPTYHCPPRELARNLVKF